MDESVFPPRAVIKDWGWDGDLSCPRSVIISSEQENCIAIQNDEESILFRTIRLRKVKTAPPKPVKKPVHTEPVKNTTFLTAPIHKMSTKELRNALKAIGVTATGSKAELRERLGEVMNARK